MTRRRGATAVCGARERANSVLAIDAADAADGGLDTPGVGLPELRELGLIHIRKVLPEIAERGDELRAVRCLLQHVAQIGHDVVRRALGREGADPEIILDVEALLL